MREIIKYYVEGECEKTLIELLKKPNVSMLKPGRIEVFNVITEALTIPRIASLKRDAIIILVYDTDIIKTDILKYNIDILRKYGFKKIYHIQSVKNFEDELVRSTNLKRIDNMFNTEGKEEFKNKFINCSNLMIKLNNIDFNIHKMWQIKTKESAFEIYYNQESVRKIKTNN